MKDNAGIALITAIIIIVVISALGVVIGALFSSKMAGTSNHLLSVQAQFIAEGGLERGIYQYAANCSGYAGESNTPLGGGNFTITLYTTDFSGNSLTGQARIRSTATIAGATRVVEQIAYCPGSGSSGMRTTGQITNNGTVKCGAQTCTQAMIDGGTCTCTQETNPTLPAVSVPNGLSGPTNDTACNPIDSNATWNAGTYYCSSLTLNSSVTITLNGAVTLYVGTFTIDSSVNLNTAGAAKNLLVLVTTGLNFNSSGSMNGYLYAPGLTVTINGTLTGGLAAANITMNGGSVFTLDNTAGSGILNYSTLIGGGGGGTQTYVYWQELPPS
ncbi:MAG: hypothetical protein ABSE95_07705 [Thermodesulfobacteriota bacterium]|jgi:hypothetical protein